MVPTWKQTMQTRAVSRNLPQIAETYGYLLELESQVGPVGGPHKAVEPSRVLECHQRAGFRAVSIRNQDRIAITVNECLPVWRKGSIVSNRVADPSWGPTQKGNAPDGACWRQAAMPIDRKETGSVRRKPKRDRIRRGENREFFGFTARNGHFR